MEKGVNVIILDDGNVIIEYNGFLGKECFEEAEKIYNMLNKLGVKVEIKEIKETEGPKIPIPELGTISRR